MKRITWKCTCYFCQRPIQRGKPAILFSTDKPEVLGICHATCGSGKYRYGQFQTCPPYRVSNDQVSFLAQFYPMLYSLPGADNPNTDLRRCLADILWKYPNSMRNPMLYLQKFQSENKYRPQSYRGDLETDFLRTLAQVQRAAKENSVGIEIDFRTWDLSHQRVTSCPACQLPLLKQIKMPNRNCLHV